MNEMIDVLKRLGVRDGFFILLDTKGVLSNEYVIDLIREASGNGCSSISFIKISLFDNALISLVSVDRVDLNIWLNDAFAKLLKYASNDKNFIQSKSVIAEILAAGLMIKCFSELSHIEECKRSKTPDFLIKNNSYLEVYCPQDSQPELERVEEELSRFDSDPKSQAVNVKIWTSYPVIGSNAKALEYSANKMIDKVVNGKRYNDQTIEKSENLLWVDILSGFDLSCTETKPYKIYCKGDERFVGSYGIFHAFYGAAEESLFAKNRFSIDFFQAGEFYKQKKNGIFRDRPSLSAAILLTSDGVVLFENPWSENKLSIEFKEKMVGIDYFRCDYSYFRVDEELSEKVIEDILLKLNCIYTGEKKLSDFE